MKVLLAPNPRRDRDLCCARRAEQLLRDMGAETSLHPLFDGASPKACLLPGQADLLLTFGGDGTFLYAAKVAASASIPVLGVNLGRLGALAGVSGERLEDLRQLAAGQYRIERRMMLRAEVFRGERRLCTATALNDVVLSRKELMHVVDCLVWFDDKAAMHVVGDGVVVATPTGSTGYALSAGGPVMEYDLEAISVTPICPHRLDGRSYILAPERTVRLTMPQRRRETALLCADGQRLAALKAGDRVEIRRCSCCAQVVRLENSDFYLEVQSKLSKG